MGFIQEYEHSLVLLCPFAYRFPSETTLPSNSCRQSLSQPQTDSLRLVSPQCGYIRARLLFTCPKLHFVHWFSELFKDGFHPRICLSPCQCPFSNLIVQTFGLVKSLGELLASSYGAFGWVPVRGLQHRFGKSPVLSQLLESGPWLENPPKAKRAYPVCDNLDKNAPDRDRIDEPCLV